MFGYVVANLQKLSAEENVRYRSYYCGLCRALGSRHGAMSRITINYDMTFLILLLSSLYEEPYTVSSERCIVHPVKPHACARNKITDYAADMNVVLAYYNFLDDWADEKHVRSLLQARLFEKESERIARRYPRHHSVICSRLQELSCIEKTGEPNPDIPANCFGSLMGELFVLEEDGIRVCVKSVQVSNPGSGKLRPGGIWSASTCRSRVDAQPFSGLLTSTRYCPRVSTVILTWSGAEIILPFAVVQA